MIGQLNVYALYVVVFVLLALYAYHSIHEVTVVMPIRQEIWRLKQDLEEAKRTMRGRRFWVVFFTIMFFLRK
jgi:hypothetical protein